MIEKQAFFALMEEIGIEPMEEDYLRFSRYAAELVDWNSRVNLTAITDDQGIAVKHFIDSLMPLTLVELPENARLIDVGTGAGFPSVPMKLLRPDLHLTLLDSLDKRLNFLRHLQSRLGYDATLVHARAEAVGRDPQHRERYHVATSRAVADLSQLAEYCLPLVRMGGLVLALKGPGGREEAEAAKNAIRLCGGYLEAVHQYNLPGGDPRTLVVLKKVSPTPPKYPRYSAQIAKKPL